MITTFTMNRKSAEKVAGFNGIDKSGKYVGTLTQVEVAESKAGATYVEFAFKALRWTECGEAAEERGEKMAFIRLFVSSRNGDRTFGADIMDALLAVLIGWIFFRSPSLPYAFSFLRALFVPGMGAPDALSWLALCIRQYGVQLALCLLLSTNLGTSVWAALGKTKAGRAGRLLFLLVVLGLSVLSMAGSGMQAFIYAQF